MMKGQGLTRVSQVDESRHCRSAYLHHIRKAWFRVITATALLLCLLLTTQPAQAYSILTHEQIVDLLWKDQLRPMLLARYPNATPDELIKAHAYAYGGCLIQDIGYYPFGNRFFSDLVHYVRSGDFVDNMLDQAQDINEYAFALGALSHYASDLAGHPEVNLAVADNFPRLKAKFGPSVTYDDSPKAHIRTEFGFDVVQVARNRFTSQAFHDFIGFEVAKPLMERAFLATYGLPLSDVLPDADLTIGSFRYSVSRLIPRMTKVAIVLKKDAILKEDPTMTRKRFLYHLKRSQFRQEWGRKYKEPGFGTRLLAFLISILPKVGPLASLDIVMPTPATETLYMQSVNNSVDQFSLELHRVEAHSLHLENKDFDTGQVTIAGEYSLTDKAYADLVNRLAEKQFAQVTPELRANIGLFYKNLKAPGFTPPVFAANEPAKWSKTLTSIAALEAMPSPLAVSP